MSVSGQITTFLSAIGAARSDQRVLDAIVLVGPKMTKEPSADGEFYSFTDKGADFLFNADERLTTIFLRPYDTDEYGVEYNAYPDMHKLITGLPAAPTRADVEEVFGRPDDTTPDAVIHQVDGRWINFEIDEDDDVVLITLMHSLPR